MSLLLAVLAFVASQAFVGAEQPLIDSNRIKSIKELFRRSDAVAVVWMTGGIPEGVGGKGFVVRASVNWAFKGVSNNESIYFRCWESCELGERYVVFLKKAGKTLEELAETERGVPLNPFPKQADYFLPTGGQGYPFPVLFDPRLGRQGVVVGLDKTQTNLPDTIPQGPLDYLPRARPDWWADYEQLKAYLIGLAQGETTRHP